MRKVVFGINMTADGYCDHTVGVHTDEMTAYFTQLMKDADTLLYGRKTYELMFPYWQNVAAHPTGEPLANTDFANAITTVPNIVVVSTTLQQPITPHTTIVRGNLAEEIKRLKAIPGRQISTGGITLPSELLKLGLIDEIHLVVHPVLAGSGRRLFESAKLDEQFGLKLLATKVFNAGHVALHYER